MNSHHSLTSILHHMSSVLHHLDLSSLLHCLSLKLTSVLHGLSLKLTSVLHHISPSTHIVHYRHNSHQSITIHSYQCSIIYHHWFTINIIAPLPMAINSHQCSMIYHQCSYVSRWRYHYPHIIYLHFLSPSTHYLHQCCYHPPSSEL
jgi:hypothetical protein